MSFIIMLSKAIAVALLATQACCSFQLNYPESAGYNTLTEPNAPCGGADANIGKSNMTFWNVGGGSIYLTSEYKVTDYLFRATLDANLTDGWVNLFPILQQNGIGDFCQPSVPVPDSFNGQTGVLQVIANTTDGLFYQCAVLMFQPGAAISPQGGCKNGSSVYSEYIANDMSLNMIANNSVEDSGASMSSASSMSMLSSISMSMTLSTTSSSISMMSTTMSSSMSSLSTTAIPSTTAASIGIVTTSPNATATPSNNSLKGGAIAGIAIGAVAVIALIFALLFLCFRRRNFKQKDQEKTSNRSKSPKQFAELSGEQINTPGTENTTTSYPAPWSSTYEACKPPQVVTTEANSAADDRSTTAASGRISGYSDLSAAVPGSPAAREQLRAEIERVRKQRLRLEEVATLSEREEELERELMRRGIES